MDLFENAVFMFSCGRVKTELFENADVTASIYDVSEHAHGSLGTTKGHFDCLFSFVEVRTAKFECSSVFVWTGIFSKTLLVWTRIFLKTDKKDAFSKISGYVLTGPQYQNSSLQSVGLKSHGKKQEKVSAQLDSLHMCISDIFSTGR